MNAVLNLTWLIPILPLLGTAAITFIPAVYRSKKISARLVIAGMVIACLLSTLVLIGTLADPATLDRLQGEQAAHVEEHGDEAHEGAEHGEHALDLPKPVWQSPPIHWMDVGLEELTLGIWVDPPAAAMLLMVSLVGSCIFVYSQGYMAAEDYDGEDQRYSRFFSFLGLFAFSMLGLVIADSIFLLFICWELVGLCSYLLIGFWNFKKSAYDAAIKAFMVTKIGDAGFFIGLFVLYIYTGNMNIWDILHNPEVLAHLATTHLPETWPIVGGASIAAFAAISLFIGTIGKSAQVPLHVWLPDAMEGPTPVSALIHAATMVAAGVFMVARMFPLFIAAGPGTLNFVAWIGGITAIFAASIAIAQYDIKRVLAYSTISQLGYMVLGLGVGGYVAGFFHLITHAFFKALLFLGSGAVIIGAHHLQDMRDMGGLGKRLPKTTWTYIIGTLALAGIFPLSGFFSKDEILLDAFNQNFLLYLIGTAAAFMTAFYMTRQLLMVFWGKPRSHGAEAAAEVKLLGGGQQEHTEHGGEAHGRDEHHGGPLPLNMTVPLMVLAICTVLLAAIGVPLDWFGLGEGTLMSRFLGAHGAFNFLVAGISTAAAFSGIAAGYLVYGLHPYTSPQDEDPLKTMMSQIQLGKLRWEWLGREVDLHLGGIYTLWEKKYYVDEIYHYTFVLGTHLVARISAWIDSTIIDGFVNLVPRATVGLARALAWFDLQMVDGLVNVVGLFTRILADIQGWIDLHIVDGIVNGVAGVTGWFGERFRRLQTGRVQDYLMLVLLGVLAVVAVLFYL